jgi:hypothetical protein
MDSQGNGGQRRERSGGSDKLTGVSRHLEWGRGWRDRFCPIGVKKKKAAHNGAAEVWENESYLRSGGVVEFFAL